MDASTFQNTEYLDMLCTWCGVNINKSDIVRKLQLYSALRLNKIKDLPKNILREFGQDIRSKINKYFTLGN